MKMIKKIEVEKLHGYLDIKIIFKNENFLLGINGSGKTSILKIINSFFNDKEMTFLKKISFKKIKIDTENNKYTIEKSLQSDRLKILTPNLRKEVNSLKSKLKNEIEEKVYIPNIFITLQRDSIETQICDFTFKAIQSELKKENNLNILTEGLDDSNDENQIVNLIKKIKTSEDDIFEEEFLKYISPIRKAKEIIKEECVKYLTYKNKLYESMTNKIKENPVDSLEEIFLEFSQNDFNLRKKIIDFTDVINSFLIDSYKKTYFDGEIIKINTLNEKIELSMDYLSSGEKHLIILFTYLNFKIKENSIILIDEPEKSLHIEWQQNFISQLRKVLNKKNVQLIVATHSPYILKDVNRTNLIGLTPYNNKKDTGDEKND